jgi:two-component system sensor histidine kinase BarA
MRGLEERLRLALEGTETGYWEWFVDTDVIEWSDNMGPLYGLPRGYQPSGVEEFVGRILEPEDREQMGRYVQAAVEDGTPYEMDIRVLLPDKGVRWLHARARAVRTDGRTERITGLLSDVTERRQREEAHAFLDAASQVLAASLDPLQTLEEVARLAVPALADWCAVQLAAQDGSGRYEQVAVAHVDPEKVHRRARRHPHRPLGALPRHRPRAARGRRARRG